MRVLAWLLATLLVACQSNLTIELEPIEGPEGGAFFGIEAFELGDKSVILAPGEFGLYQNDGKGFSKLESQKLPSFRVVSFEHLRDPMSTYTFPRESLFAAHEGQVWLVDADSRLWMSLDGGRTFNFVEPPNTDVGPLEIRPTDPPRLLVNKDIYLVDSNHIWRLNQLQSTQAWESVSLYGVLFEPTPNTQLPPTIRNYLPATNGRSFEILTVLGEQLFIYRREAKTADETEERPWVLVSTFPTADKQLVGVIRKDANLPASKSIFMVTPQAVFRSDDEGEEWTRFWPVNGSLIENFLVLQVDNNELAIATTHDGAIWRHDGKEWQNTRASSATKRPITSLTTLNNSIWAATLGEGILKSDDQGLTWHPHNRNLSAVRINAFKASAKGLFIATDSGVYSRTQNGSWEVLSNDPSSSLIQSGDQILVGTYAGSILRLPEGTPALLEASQAPEVLPRNLKRVNLPATAVTLLHTRAGKVLAATRNNGIHQSVDNGVTWTPIELPDALLTTLTDSTISHVLNTNTMLVLAEQSPRRASPLQLWTSSDNGTSWAASRSFRIGEEETILWPAEDDTVFAAQRDGIESTQDFVQWTSIKGPWKNAHILGYAMDKQRAAILADISGTPTLFVRDAVSNDPTSRFRVNTTDSFGLTTLLDFQILNRDVYILTSRGLLKGRLPTSDSSYEESLPLLLAMIGLCLAIGAGFLILRRFS
jgi:photosystem II stability/assembly factor-like uncharacterized protein